MEVCSITKQDTGLLVWWMVTSTQQSSPTLFHVYIQHIPGPVARRAATWDN